jgi:hypothetical protein
MNKQEAFKRFRPQFIMVICGALLFSGTTFFSVLKTGNHYPDEAGYWYCIPAALLMELVGFDALPKDSFIHSNYFLFIAALSINGLLGAVLFGLVASILTFIVSSLKFIVRGNREN